MGQGDGLTRVGPKPPILPETRREVGMPLVFFSRSMWIFPICAHLSDHAACWFITRRGRGYFDLCACPCHTALRGTVFTAS